MSFIRIEGIVDIAEVVEDIMVPWNWWPEPHHQRLTVDGCQVRVDGCWMDGCWMDGCWMDGCVFDSVTEASGVD